MASFIAERETMMEAMSFASRYASKDNRIPVLKNALLSVGDGRVRVTTTDVDMASSVDFSATSKEAGYICLPADLLTQALKSTRGCDVEVVSDMVEARVSIGKSKFRFPVLPADDFPHMPMLTSNGDAEVVLDGSILSRLSSEVWYAALPKDDWSVFSGIAWVFRDLKLEFWATDRHQLSMFSVDAPMGASNMPPIIIPPIDLPEWDGQVLVSVTKAFIRFEHGGRTVASKLIDATYPDCRAVLPQNNSTSIRFDRKEMIDAINRVSLVADAKEHSILFVGRDGRIELSAETPRGSVVDEVAFEGDDFQTAIIRRMSLASLNSFGCETMEWRWADHASPVTAHDARDDARLSVMFPYRDRRLSAFVPQREAA